MRKKVIIISFILMVVFAFVFKFNPKILDSSNANVLLDLQENDIVSSEISSSPSPTSVSTVEPTETPIITPSPTIQPVVYPNKGIDAFSEKYFNLSINEKLSLLKEWLPAGKYWNKHDLTNEDLPDGERLLCYSETPCVGYEETHCHRYYGSFSEQYYVFETIQCLGFASFVSDFLFGQDAPVIEVEAGFENIKIGDHLRFEDIPHSVIVIDKNETEIFVVEVNRNYDCLIEWGRSITQEELEDINYYILTRN